MWPFNRKKTTPRKSTFSPTNVVSTEDYSVEETTLTELSDTDLNIMATCQERHKQMKEGTLVEDFDPFSQTRWNKNRR